MGEAALGEAVKADLTPPKPNRRKRLALRFAWLVVAVTLLSATYWFARPQQLRWWTSPVFVSSGNRVRLLLPHGWDISICGTVGGPDGLYQELYEIIPKDNRPSFLRRLFPDALSPPHLALEAGCEVDSRREHLSMLRVPNVQILNTYGRMPEKSIKAKRTNTWAKIYVMQPKGTRIGAFYSQICNSLTIE
jgi:hypothetical protein